MSAHVEMELEAVLRGLIETHAFVCVGSPICVCTYICMCEYAFIDVCMSVFMYKRDSK